MLLLLAAVAMALSLLPAQGKVFERCELMRELQRLEVPEHQVPVWVCIAEHESQYNTSAVGHLNGDGSGDHGIFQISDLYWCSPPGKGWACGVTCAQLEDDDIEDDYNCARRIYREHKTLSGNGFNAWAVFQPHCTGERARKYVEGCSGQQRTTPEPSTPSLRPSTSSQRPSTPGLGSSTPSPVSPRSDNVFHRFTASVSRSTTRAPWGGRPSLFPHAKKAKQPRFDINSLSWIW